MKKIIVVASLALTMVLGLAGTSHAWLFRNKIQTDVNNNSHNDSSVNDSTFSTRTTTSNSFNKIDNRDYRYDIDNSARDNRSFDSHAITDSYKGNVSENSTGKRVYSHNMQGDVRNSVLGDFNQSIGADFSGGFTGSASSIDAHTTNSQTFGDVTILGKEE